MAEKRNVHKVLDQAPDLWSPHVVGEVNDYDVKVANVCDTNYTSLAKVDKRWLPARSGELVGVHDRLREVGRAYLAQR